MENLLKYCLRLGDNSLILSHRLGEYSSYGPFLEEDLAITNVALDHIGQAESFLKYAAELEDEGRTEDDLAYRRPETQFYNVQLVEQPNTDYAYITARQFFIDTYNYFLYTELANSSDETIAAIAAKSLKEITYHLRRSSEWMIRLGDGTEESHRRIQEAVDNLWMYTGELFEMDETDKELIGKNIAPDLNKIQQEWDTRINEIFELATIKRPENNYMATGSRKGYHSEHMGFILAQMQFLPRAYPDATW
jgi:ring-1,2-phenylacetyl-CoA epoxidase subunit PaaC